MSKWTVWVGGSEVNLVHLSQQQAENMAQAWKDEGYDDVAIRREREGGVAVPTKSWKPLGVLRFAARKERVKKLHFIAWERAREKGARVRERGG